MNTPFLLAYLDGYLSKQAGVTELATPPTQDKSHEDKQRISPGSPEQVAGMLEELQLDVDKGPQQDERAAEDEQPVDDTEVHAASDNKSGPTLP